MQQKKIVFSMSLNPIPSIIVHIRFVDKWKLLNKNARIDGLGTISWSDFKQRYGYYQAVRLEFDRLAYYKSKGCYLNGVMPRTI